MKTDWVEWEVDLIKVIILELNLNRLGILLEKGQSVFLRSETFILGIGRRLDPVKFMLDLIIIICKRY